MRVLLVHNSYKYAGGEDGCVSQESELLGRYGIEVRMLQSSNNDVIHHGVRQTASSLWRAPFNREVYRQVRETVRAFRPDVVHVHNFWYALSPAVHAAARAEGAAVVQTLHNFRLLCVNALLFHQGRPCTDCLGQSAGLGVLRRCYHDSALLSALVWRMIHHNRRRGTWENDVDAFIALSRSSRELFVAGGLPAEKITVKPNFVEDPGPGSPPGKGALFLGRLSAEKGIGTLLRAWERLPAVALTIAGDGPLRREMDIARLRSGTVSYLGPISGSGCLAELRRAGFLVVPSTCNETFGRVIIEAFACGRPVIASRLGAMAELVEEGRTGLLFEPGNPEDLADKVRWLVARPGECRRMGREARREYEEKYTPEANFLMLMEIYQQAIERSKGIESKSRESSGSEQCSLIPVGASQSETLAIPTEI